MLPNLCKIYQNIYNTFFPLSPEPTKITRHSHLWLIKYLHADLTITDRTVITGNIEKANFASLIYFEEKYHGSEKPFYLTVAEVDIYIAPLDVKQNSLAVPLGIPSAAPLEAPPAPPLDSNPPSASEKKSTTTSLPSEDPNTIIAAWAEPCEPKIEARKERYPSEECYWDNLAGLITAARKAMVWTPRRNRLEDGDWVVGYMHRNIIQKEKEKGEDAAHEDEVVVSLKIDINFGTDETDSQPSQALQVAPKPVLERYKRITVSGTKRRVCEDAEIYFQDAYPSYEGTSETVGEMEVWSCKNLGNMQEGDLVAVWVIPEKLVK